MTKPYTDEEIASVREAMRKRAVSACTPDHSRWLATLDEARAEVARLRELDEQRVELIRESMERGSEIARLRERVRDGEGLLREIQGSAASFDEMNSYEREDFATDEWMERMEELLRERNALHDSIDTYLAAADTTKNTEGVGRAASGRSPAKPAPSASREAFEAWCREQRPEWDGLLFEWPTTSHPTFVERDRSWAYGVEREWRGWQASRAALPDRGVLIDAFVRGLVDWNKRPDVWPRIPVTDELVRYLSDRIHALIGGDDAE